MAAIRHCIRVSAPLARGDPQGLTPAHAACQRPVRRLRIFWRGRQRLCRRGPSRRAGDPSLLQLLCVLCCPPQLGGVSDEASEALAEVRARRRDNSEELRRLMDGLARQLYEKGASDSRSVTLIRERYSVGIKVRGAPEGAALRAISSLRLGGTET